MPKFVPFDRRFKPMPDIPHVTLQREGRLISMNQKAYQLLQSPASVELNYDPDEKLIGIRAIKPTDERGFAIRKQGHNNSGFEVAAQAFTRYWGIDTSIARRYKAYMEGPYLVIDLKSEGVDATGIRSKFRKPKP
jgi:hypothetical protein